VITKPRAVLFDRDGTLVVDVPYNGNPDLVEPMPGARDALDLLRAAGIPTAVVSNQSAIGRGLITPDQCDAVFARLAELLGPLGPVTICPHTPEDGCDCRKPQPGLVRRAAAALGVPVEDCVMIGDIGADVQAAQAAGARAVLVPTPQTRPEEIVYAEQHACVASDLLAAVRLLLAGEELAS
jgi:D-glycero-D-manno-heptose 1,7-bisphosphate phosphatase